MARRESELRKKSLVVDGRMLRRWVRMGRYRNESEAVRAAIARAVAIQQMTEAVHSLQQRGTFGRHTR